LAKRTASGLNEIRKLINVEEKIIQVSKGATACGTSGALESISTVAQGTNFTERIGNSIKLQHISVRGRIFLNNSATRTVVRILLIRDLDGYGTTPNVGDIMESTGSAPDVLSPYDFLNRKRFSYLYDELVTINNTGDSSTVFQIEIPHEGHILYLGSTAAAASNGKGSLYLLFISDESTHTPTYSFYSRVLFTDD
jgi:hypothetical protein